MLSFYVLAIVDDAQSVYKHKKSAALNSSFGWGGIVLASNRTSTWGELAGYWATLIRGTKRALTPRYFNPNLCHRLMNIQRGVFLSSNDIRSLTPVKPTPNTGCLSSKTEWADYFCPEQWNVRVMWKRQKLMSHLNVQANVLLDIDHSYQAR